MIFDLSEEQRDLRDAVAELLERSAPPARLVAHADGADLSESLWAELTEMGVLAAAVPEEHAGLGLPWEVVAPILELAGRHALPVSLIETVAVALPLLVATDDATVKGDWLPRLAGGGARVAVRYSPGDPVAFAETADLLLERDAEGWTLAPAGAFEIDPLPSIDPARPMADVRVTSAARVPLSAQALEVVESSIETAVASTLIGIAARILDMTVEYVKQREQFGRQIGSFQAVKHKLADIWMAVEAARSASWYAAHLVSRGGQIQELPSSVARLAAVRAAELAVRDGLQLHGAIGFTWEHPLHLWLKQGRSFEQVFGGPRASLDRLRRVAVASS